MSEAPLSSRSAGRRGDGARETLFQRIDAIVGSIRPTADLAEVMASHLRTPQAPKAATPAVAATASAVQPAAAQPKALGENDPVFGRLLERWFALERDRVLGEHLHLDQVKAVATAYAVPEAELRVVR